MTAEIKKAEERINGTESSGVRVMIVSFDDCEMYVAVPQTIKSEEQEITDTVKSFYEGLIEARSGLSVMPSKIKSDGRTRSTREMRDIKLVREKKLNSVRAAIEIFRGRKYGIVELIPTIDRETNEVKASGFKIRYE